MTFRMLAIATLWISFISGGDIFASENSPAVKVIDVVGEKAAEPGDKVTLKIENLQSFYEAAKSDGKEIIPYIDGLPLKGVETIMSDPDTLWFYLLHSEESKETWTSLARHRDDRFSSLVTLSIGLADSFPVPTKVKDNFRINFINKHWFIACSIAIVFILALFIWLAYTSNIIRDAGPNPEGGARRPFSIGRTQMTVWFFLVIASYPFLWLITGELGTITESILGLMGISAGTALGSTVIDVSKGNASLADNEKLVAEKKVLETRKSELEAATSADPAPPDLNALKTELDNKRVRLAEIDEQILKSPVSRQGRKSKGFFLDVVSDANGVSFHRFQIFAWTIVLGIIFISEVMNNLKMPEFSGTLLALMGVSSGTYIGFKFPEQKNS